MDKKLELIKSLKLASKHINKAAKLWKEIDPKHRAIEPLEIGVGNCEYFIEELKEKK